jgi:hypothetical protein
VPVFAGGRVVAGIVMRYMKSTMKAAQLEALYVPIVKTLARDIASAYERRMCKDSEIPQVELADAPEVEAAFADLPLPFTARGTGRALLSADVVASAWSATTP